MKTNLKCTLALLALTGLGATGARAADVTLDLPVSSAYVWRGIVLNDMPVFQPSMTANAPNGLSFNAWASMDLTSRRATDKGRDAAGNPVTHRATEPFQFAEVDLTVSYKLPVKQAEVFVGYIEYIFPNSVNSHGENTMESPVETGEIFASVGRSDWWLQPKLQLNWDVRATHGGYLNASVHHGWDLADNFNLGAGASVGAGSGDYNRGNFGVDDNNLADGSLALDATYKFSKALSIGATAQYTILLADQIKQGANAASGYFNNSDNGILVGTVRLTYNF